MADDNKVTVEFGAKIDDLIKSVDQIKSKLGEIHEFTVSAQSGFESLGNIIKTILSVEVIKSIEEVIVKLAELGTKTQTAMVTLGASAETITQLSGMAFIGGTSLDALTNAFGRLYLNVQRSTRDAFTPGAQAMKVLGISASELTKSGGDAGSMIETLHNSISRFAPSMNLFAAVEALAGRNVANLIPLLIKSGEEWKTVKESVDAAQKGLAAAIPGMEQTDAKIKLMELALGSMAARIFTVFKPAIDSIVTWITNLAKSISSEDIRTAVLFVGNWLITFGTSLAKFFVDLKAMIDKFVADMNTSLISIHTEEGSVADVIISKVMGGDTAAQMRANPVKERLKEIDDAAKASKQSIDELGNSLRANLGSGLALPSGGAGKPTGGGDAAGAMGFGDLNAIQERIARIQQQIAIEKGQFDQLKIQYQLDADLYSTTETTKVARTIQAAQQMLSVENTLLTQIRDQWPEHSRRWEEAERRRVQATMTATTQLKQLNADYVRTARAEIGGYVDAISSSWNSSLRGVLAGTTKFSDAMRKMFGDLIIYMIEQIEKKFIFEQAKTALTTLLYGTQATAAVAAEGVKTTAAETGAAARTGSVIGEALTAIGAYLAEAFAGLTAFFSFLGPAAPAAALGVVGLAGAAAFAMIKKLDVGTDYVTQTGLAVVHQGEQVVPAQTSGPFTGANAGGSPMHIHINAVDARSFASMLRNNPSAITDVFKKAMRDNQLGISQHLATGLR